jgi:ATP-binding cassette, subfamily B, bacterial PglK
LALLVATARRALALIGTERRWKWLVLVILALVVAGFEALGAGLIFALVTVVSAEGDAPSLPIVGDLTALFPAASRRTLEVGIAVVAVAFFLVRAGVVIGQQYIQARVVQNAGAQVASRLVRGYMAMPYLFHTQRNSAELVRNAFDSAQRLVAQVMMPLVNIMAEGVLAIGLTILLVMISPTATLLAAVGFLPTIWILQRVVQPRLKRLGHRSQVARKGSLQSVQQALAGFRDIRLLGQEDHFAEVFQEQRTDLAVSEYRKMALAALPRTLIETALVIIIVAVFLFTLFAGQGFQTAAATLSVFAYVGLRLQPSMQKIVHGLNEIRFGSAVLDDLSDDYERIEHVRALDQRNGKSPRAPLGRSIELRGVTFNYVEGDAPALCDIDLTIRRGEFVGICGPTGGGKSTLIDIIVGLLPPTQGEVRIDGELLGVRDRGWHQQLGVVSQDVFLIDDTLRANIAFGRSEGDIDDEAIRRAVSRAQLDQVIADLPNGLDTEVGERGVRLSGGQRQRIAIARALYREPAVLVFDEGTSALDSATEAALVAALDELKEGRTLITVAHRIATVRRADRILVVSGGRIVTEGPYGQLLETSDLFRSLAR